MVTELSTMITFLIFLVAFKHSFCEGESYNDNFHERLLIKPLQSGHVYTHFQFVVQKDLKSEFDESAFHHFRLFPRSLGETLSKYNVLELHFSLTQGLWRSEKWGYPIRSAPPGAELWTVFKGNVSEVSSNWQKLTNIMSGQFCSSLNFIDDTNTAIPKLSLRPEGAVDSNNYNSSFIRYASLPPEIACTENLTPFGKLLPCHTKAGLPMLFNALNIFSAPFVSLSVDIQRICKDDTCSKTAIELIQSVSIVFDPPVQQMGKQDWSFVKLFGAVVTRTCPLASSTKVYVDTSSNKNGASFSLSYEPNEVIVNKEELDSGMLFQEKTYAVYDMNKLLEISRQVNIGATYNDIHIYGVILPPVLYADRKISGYGQEHGGIHCTFYNNHPVKPLKIIYFDVVPWYLRLYSHTLTVKNGDKVIIPDYFHYLPAQDRKRPHHLEIVLTLPPRSTTEMSIDFDFAFLKWTEYPPDANHGFYVGSAVISSVLDTGKNISKFPGHTNTSSISTKHFLRLHTQILLVSLPTPDFSMPYNVICLTCTVVALAFGPIHNITTKSLCPLDEKENESFISKLKNKIKNWWKSKGKTSSEKVEDDDSKPVSD